LSWQYLGTTDEGDRYELERTYPAEEPNQATTRKELVFSGKVLVLFDDDLSTVVMRPQASNEQGTEIDDRVN
jgi:hypothetical protein